MRPLKRVLAAFILSAAAVAGAAAQPAPLIDTLIAERAGATRPAELTILLRLQLAAGRFEAAEATIQRLAALYQDREPHRARSLTPWRIYARWRCLLQSCAQHGLDNVEPRARACSEARLVRRELEDVESIRVTR